MMFSHMSKFSEIFVSCLILSYTAANIYLIYVEVSADKVLNVNTQIINITSKNSTNGD